MEAVERQPLTTTQLTMFRVILWHFAAYQRWPTMRELSRMRGHAGYTNNEWQLLRRMKLKGWLMLPDEMSGRGDIRIVGLEPFLAEAVRGFLSSISKDLEKTDVDARSRPAAE